MGGMVDGFVSVKNWGVNQQILSRSIKKINSKEIKMLKRLSFVHSLSISHLRSRSPVPKVNCSCCCFCFVMKHIKTSNRPATIYMCVCVYLKARLFLWFVPCYASTFLRSNYVEVGQMSLVMWFDGPRNALFRMLNLSSSINVSVILTF